jgi:hypothetical protein
MNAVILNGMDRGDTYLASVQEILVSTLQEKDWYVKPLSLHDLDVKPCGGCFGC